MNDMLVNRERVEVGEVKMGSSPDGQLGSESGFNRRLVKDPLVLNTRTSRLSFRSRLSDMVVGTTS